DRGDPVTDPPSFFCATRKRPRRLLVGFDSELYAVARGWIHAADGRSAAGFVLDRGARDGMESGATGRHNEGLGVDGTLDGPRFPEQVHGGVSGRVLCDLFSAATRSPRSFAPGWSIRRASH